MINPETFGFKKIKEHIYKNESSNEIEQIVRPYLYYEPPCIMFSIPNLPEKEKVQYIEGSVKQRKGVGIKERLLYFTETWLIDYAMLDGFYELSQNDQEEVYIKNRQKKEYNFKEYDELFKPKEIKVKKLPKKLQNKEKIIIYRGISSKSDKSKSGVKSWSLNKKVAEFFRDRFKDKNGYILIGLCKVKDFEAYYGGPEEEVLVDISKVIILNSIIFLKELIEKGESI